MADQLRPMVEIAALENTPVEELERRATDPIELASLLVRKGIAAARADRADEAKALLVRARVAAEGSKAPAALLEVLVIGAQVLAMVGDTEGARAMLGEAPAGAAAREAGARHHRGDRAGAARHERSPLMVTTIRARRGAPLQVVRFGAMSDPLVTTPDARRGLPIRTLCVQVLDGPDAGLVHRAREDQLAVGTADGNDMVLTDDSVSRYHLELSRGRSGVRVVDCGSTAVRTPLRDSPRSKPAASRSNQSHRLAGG